MGRLALQKGEIELRMSGMKYESTNNPPEPHIQDETRYGFQPAP